MMINEGFVGNKRFLAVTQVLIEDGVIISFPLMAMTFNQPKSTTAIRANKLYEQHTQCPLN